MPRIIVVRGNSEQTIELKPGTNVVGRGSQCQVSINDATMSREHCHLVVDGGVVEVVDLGSRNGTIVNGHRVGRKKLEPGDQIRIGETVIHFELKRSTQRVESRAPSQVSARYMVKDFSVWVPGTMARVARLVRAVVGAVLAVGLVVVCVVVGSFLAGELSKKRVINDNLIKGNPGFEPGVEPAGLWVVGGENRIAVDRVVFRTGAGSLAVDKSGQDLVLEMPYREEFPLEGGKIVNASVWTKFDGFRGWGSIKVSWLARGGYVLLEEFAPPKKDCSDWTQISAQFTPPEGAQRFRVSLVLLGRGGRVYFDDLQVTNRIPGERAQAPRLGDYTFLLSRQGAFCCITWRRIHVITNNHLYLHNDKEGRVPSTFADPVKPEVVSSKISLLKGRLITPVGLRDATYLQEIAYEDGEVTVAYVIDSPEIRLIDRVEIVTDLPHATELSTPGGEEMTRRVNFRIRDHEFVIDYPETVQVKVEPLGNGRRLRQFFPVGRQKDRFVTGFKLRELSTTVAYYVRRLEQRREEARKNEDFAAVRSICRELLQYKTDPREQAKYQSIIDEIDKAEELLWQSTLMLVWKALISRRPELAQEALREIDRFLKQYYDSARADEAEGFKNELIAITQARGDESDYPRRLLERARAYLESGKELMARDILTVVVRKYPGTEFEREAGDLLSRIREK